MLFSLFNDLGKVINKIDAENKEFYLLGDLNCDLFLLFPKSSRESNSRVAFTVIFIYLFI